MKRQIVIALVALFALCAVADTWTDSVGKIWSYSVAGDTATVTGVSPANGKIVIPSSVNDYPVTSIGNRAFSNCSGLTGVTIPDGVTSIGNWAFDDCYNLTSVTMPDSVTDLGNCAFYGCSGLTSMTIPDGVTRIGDRAFYDCDRLTAVTIPEGVTRIGDSAFDGCWGLTIVTMPDSVTDIGNGAFRGCDGLTSVTIPASVTSIGKYAFSYCRGLTAVTIPEGVTRIGNGAFSGCRGLTSVTIPEGVTSIGDWAFTGLPPGLKFTAKGLDVKATKTTPAAHYDAYTIYGTATKPGTYPVKAKITNATVKKAVERWFTIVVDNLTDANGLLLVTDAASGEPIPLKNASGEKYTVYAGVEKHELPAITPFEESDKLTVSGLPAGLRYDAKLRKFTGVPTKAGTYTVTATVRSGRVSSVSTFTVEVVALPEWAIGTFVGSGVHRIGDYTPFTNNLCGTVTVAANGKVSGKVMFDTDEDRLLTASFSEPSFTGYDEGTKRYYCDVYLAFRDGRDVVDEQIRRLYIVDDNFAVGPLVQKIGWGWMDGYIDEETGVEVEDGFEFNFRPNVWKIKGFKDLLPQLAAKKTTVSVMGAPIQPDGTADLTLDIAPNGTVSATLVLKDGGNGKRFVAKGDLIILGYESADASESGKPVYGAFSNFAFGSFGLLHAEILMGVSEDGKIRAEGCEIVSVDRFAAEEAEEEPEVGE